MAIVKAINLSEAVWSAFWEYALDSAISPWMIITRIIQIHHAAIRSCTLTQVSILFNQNWSNIDFFSILMSNILLIHVNVTVVGVIDDIILHVDK